MRFKVNIRMRITIAFIGLILVFALVSSYVGFTVVRRTAEQGAISKAQSDLALGEALIDAWYPRPWEVRDDGLYKGNARMNDNFALVDEIARRTGGTATIFQGDTRIATTVRKMGTDERAIGTQAAPNVVEQVLQKGKPYYGEALVAGHWYQTAYTPLRDAEGRKRQAP